MGKGSFLRAALIAAFVTAASLFVLVSVGAASVSVSVACSSSSLISAIASANSSGGGTINLASGCHYALTTPDNGENGLPVVTSRINVNGNGATIDGTNSVRVLEVDGPGGNLSLKDVTITGGSAADFGGGIANIDGAVALNHSRVTGNTAVVAGGGIASATFDPSSVAKLTLNNSAVSDNQQTLDGLDGGLGGGGILNILGTVSLNGGGIASGNGNGGFPPGTSQLRLNNSQVDGNTATAAGGEGPPIAAGGIANGSDAVLNNTEVDDNTASHTSGAGIVNHGTMSLNNSEVNGNTAAGSGLLASGGGILNAQGPPGAGTVTLTLNNSRVNNNSAGGDGGGIANGVPFPGPMPLVGGTVTLRNSQVTGNHAAHGGGIFNSGGTVTLSNTAVTGNVVDNCEPTGTIAGCTA